MHELVVKAGDDAHAGHVHKSDLEAVSFQHNADHGVLGQNPIELSVAERFVLVCFLHNRAFCDCALPGGHRCESRDVREAARWLERVGAVIVEDVKCDCVAGRTNLARFLKSEKQDAQRPVEHSTKPDDPYPGPTQREGFHLIVNRPAECLYGGNKLHVVCMHDARCWLAHACVIRPRL